jgi:hypothetical protein
VNLSELPTAFPLDVANGVSHAELQALVSELAGSALEDDNEADVAISGLPPMELESTWREGFVVNDSRRCYYL